MGVAGTVTSWATADANRDAQEDLARAERLFERRATVYVDAILLAGNQIDTLDTWADSPVAGLPSRPPLREIGLLPLLKDKRIYARVRAFGSDDAVAAYEQLRRRAESFETTWDHGRTELVVDELYADIDGLRGEAQAFATVARTELRE